MKQTAITIIIDDINKKITGPVGRIVDASNRPRGTRSYNIERFSTIPMFSANWRYPVTNERAQTRTITIPFFQHHELSELHMELVAA